MPVRVGIDVGGTFTDLVAVAEDGGVLVRVKVPSVPAAPDEGAMSALDTLLERIDAADLSLVSHSTTIATNALLGQIGLDLPRIALFVTEGFRDVIEIGRQNRSEVYNLNVTRRRPLVARGDRISVRERMDFRGQPIVPLSEVAIEAAVDELRRREGVTSVAVSFLHAYANDAHERALADALRTAFPRLDLSLSSDVDPAYREYERTSTTVVNASLRPLVRGYLRRIASALHDRRVRVPLYVMQSGGGMASADAAANRPAAIVEGGPASGVIAAAFLARALGIANALSFDMGGTTAKAGTVVNGVPQVVGELEVAGRTHSGRVVRGSGYPVRFPFVDLAEVGAGGGSIAFIDEGGALRVGPLSAGADPGPAAYGKSLRPTVTDANIVLGRLNPRALLGGAFPLDAQRARSSVESLVPALDGLSLDETAAGIVALVDDAMAKVLRIVTLERGHDPRGFTLLAFGGAGPLHACALASELGVARIVVPPAPGVFSAFGLLVADLTATSARSVVAPDEASAEDVEALLARTAGEAHASLQEQGVPSGATRVVREIDARYAGQSFELTLPAAAPFDESARAAFTTAFHRRHEQVYGFASPEEYVELVTVRSTAVGDVPKPKLRRTRQRVSNAPARDGLLERRDAFFAQTGRVLTPVYDRQALPSGTRLDGPAIVEELDASILVLPGWHADVDELENLILAPA